MPSRPVLIGSCALLLGTLAAGTCRVSAQGYIETDPFDAAVMALEKAVRVDQEGSNHAILLALRQLEDPAVVPLFQRLLDSEDPTLRIDALLALAELGDGRIDPFLLERFNTKERIVALAAAIDLDLLDEEVARRIESFKERSQVEILMVAAAQIDLGIKPDSVRIRSLMDSDDPATRMVAAILLEELGEDAGLEQLQAMYLEEDLQTRGLIAGAVVDLGTWHPAPTAIDMLLQIAHDQELPRAMRLAAVDSALACKCDAGIELWHDAGVLTEAAGDRTRLGVAALERGIRTPDWSGIRDERKLNQYLARAGEALASGDAVVESSEALIKIRHPLMLQGAFALAEHGSPEDAEAIRIMILELAVKDPRLTEVAGRTITDLVDSDSDKLEPALDLIAVQGKPLLSEFAMVGLMNARKDPASGELARRFRENKEKRVRSLALVAMARHGVVLNEEELLELGTIASGGGRVDPTTRALAAWFWLGSKGDQQRAIAEVVKEA